MSGPDDPRPPPALRAGGGRADGGAEWTRVAVFHRPIASRTPTGEPPRCWAGKGGREPLCREETTTAGARISIRRIGASVLKSTGCAEERRGLGRRAAGPSWTARRRGRFVGPVSASLPSFGG